MISKELYEAVTGHKNDLIDITVCSDSIGYPEHNTNIYKLAFLVKDWMLQTYLVDISSGSNLITDNTVREYFADACYEGLDSFSEDYCDVYRCGSNVTTSEPHAIFRTAQNVHDLLKPPTLVSKRRSRV